MVAVSRMCWLHSPTLFPPPCAVLTQEILAFALDNPRDLIGFDREVIASSADPGAPSKGTRSTPAVSMRRKREKEEEGVG